MERGAGVNFYSESFVSCISVTYFNTVLDVKLLLAVLSFSPLCYIYVCIGVTNDAAKLAGGYSFVCIPHYPPMLA